MKIRRDECGTAILDTTKDRVIFTSVVIISILLMILVTATFFWLPYWVITRKNAYRSIVE